MYGKGAKEPPVPKDHPERIKPKKTSKKSEEAKK